MSLHKSTTSSIAVDASIATGTTPKPGSALWLHVWYAVIRSLPAARGCDAELRVTPAPVPTDDPDCFRVGEFEWLSSTRSRITVAQGHTPPQLIATLVHEVAHYAQNGRHVKRSHGYSWRRAFAQLCTELTGAEGLSEDAKLFRVYDERGRWLRPKLRPSREVALDEAVERTIADGQPWLYRGDRFLEAWIGPNRFTVPGVLSSICLRK